MRLNCKHVIHSDHQNVPFPSFTVKIWSSVQASHVEAPAGGPHLEKESSGLREKELDAQSHTFGEQLC